MTLLRRELHAYPEPAFEEEVTGRRIEQVLAEIPGIKIERNIGKTGLVAVIGEGKKGRCIALRADMDCLRIQEKNTFPHVSKRAGLMHGCGHDGHVACLVGASLVLGNMQDQMAGPVKCIFQPAEENFGGAEKMVADGCLADPVPAAIFALHSSPGLPVGCVGTRQGPMMAASRYFTITLRGKGTHAAMPQRGDDLILVGSQIVCAAHTIVARDITPMDAALISIPRFAGNSAPNVLPEEVELEGTLRALSNEGRSYLEQRLEQVAKGVAAAYNVEADIIFNRGYPLLENDPDACTYMKTCAAEELGAENVKPDYPASMSAEDFSFYLQKVPGAFGWLGNGNGVPLHNPCYDFNDDALEVGIRILCRLALNSERISS